MNYSKDEVRLVLKEKVNLKPRENNKQEGTTRK